MVHEYDKYDLDYDLDIDDVWYGRAMLHKSPRCAMSEEDLEYYLERGEHSGGFEEVAIGALHDEGESLHDEEGPPRPRPNRRRLGLPSG